MEELQRKNKELDGLVTYLRSVIETKDGKISDLEHQLQSAQQEKQSAIFDIRQQHMNQVQALSCQVKTLTEANKKLQGEIGLAMNSRQENAFLKQQLSEL